MAYESICSRYLLADHQADRDERSFAIPCDHPHLFQKCPPGCFAHEASLHVELFGHILELASDVFVVSSKAVRYPGWMRLVWLGMCRLTWIVLITHALPFPTRRCVHTIVDYEMSALGLVVECDVVTKLTFLDRGSWRGRGRYKKYVRLMPKEAFALVSGTHTAGTACNERGIWYMAAPWTLCIPKLILWYHISLSIQQIQVSQ